MKKNDYIIILVLLLLTIGTWLFSRVFSNSSELDNITDHYMRVPNLVIPWILGLMASLVFLMMSFFFYAGIVSLHNRIFHKE